MPVSESLIAEHADIANAQNFWQGASRYGVLHSGARTHRFKNSRCLLVFVHGLFGDCRKTWGKMPEWVLTKADVDIDTISFDYPSKVWQRSSIEQAADDLATWLNTEFEHYRHIIFVTHSTGGLVVKQLLSNAFVGSIETHLDKGAIDYAANNSLWFRTRRVINIAVPHQGGSPVPSTLGMVAHKMLYPVAWPVLALIRFLTQGSKDLGRNEIIAALHYKNPELFEWEQDFLQQQAKSETAGLPYPIVQDICAKSDLSVRYQTNTRNRQIYFRGTHKSIKIPRRINAPMVTIVAEIVKKHGGDIGPMIVDGEMGRIAAVNRMTSTQKLIDTTVCGIGADRDRPQPSLANVASGTQSEVVEAIVNAVQNGSEQVRQLVVTGSAGVGKSLVTRMIAWRLGLDYLSNPGNDHPLPLFIPLQQVTATEETAQDYTWEMLWQWWLQWGQSIYPDIECDLDWLDQHFHQQPVTIILDGLDDFLYNHPNLSFAYVVNMLRSIRQRYGDNPHLTIVIGIRNSVHGLERLADNPRDIYEILRLSIVQAKQLFSACKDWIDTIRDRNLLDLILTPLILSNYEPDPTCQINQDAPMTQAAIMCQTMRTVLARSRLVGSPTQTGQVIEIDHLGRAMTLIAWLFFSKSRGEINIDTLRREAAQHRQQWQHFFTKMRSYDEDFYYASLHDEADQILTSFSLLEQESICQALLERTVFVPTSANQVRFSHRQWQEFLLGQFFVFCLRTHHFEQLGVTAFHSRIYRMAGETFANKIISESCIQTLLHQWRNTHNTYITGNVIAFLAWTTTSIEAKAIQLLLNEVAAFEPLSRLIMIGGLGHRVLTARPCDDSLTDIRRALFPVLQQFSDPDSTPVDDPVATSMSWCYHQAFAEQFGVDHPSKPWPEIDFDDQTTTRLLPMICTVKDNQLILDARSRSFQKALLTPVLDIFNDSKMTIRALHYLYYLLVARKHAVHVHELSQELPQLLESGCQFEQIIEAFTLVPETLKLYRNCQAMHQQLEAGRL